MKTFLTALIIMATVMNTSAAMTQYHRHTPRTESQTATESPATKQKVTAKTNPKKKKSSIKKEAATAVQEKESIEAYSDTTTDAQQPNNVNPDDTLLSQLGAADFGTPPPLNDFMNMSNIMLESIFIIAILFIFSPLAILALIFYFIYKNRKQKYKLAEMAIKTGHAIPENILQNHTNKNTNLWSKGIKNITLGIGMICAFWFIDVSLGRSIGMLLMFYGIGQVIIARTTEKKDKYFDKEYERKEKSDKDRTDYQEL